MAAIPEINTVAKSDREVLSVVVTELRHVRRDVEEIKETLDSLPSRIRALEDEYAEFRAKQAAERSFRLGLAKKVGNGLWSVILVATGVVIKTLLGP